MERSVLHALATRVVSFFTELGMPVNPSNETMTLRGYGVLGEDLDSICVEIEEGLADEHGIEIIILGTDVDLDMTLNQLVDAIMALLPAS